MKRLTPAVAALALFFSACADSPVETDLLTADAPAYGLSGGKYVDLGLVRHSPEPTPGIMVDIVSGPGPAADAVAGAVLNGSFEDNGGPNSTILNHWTTFNAGNGAVFAQTGTVSPLAGFEVPAPPDGDFAAMSAQGGPGQHIWFQDVQVPANRSELHFDLFIGNRAGVFFSPPTLAFIGVGPNQQFRADIMDPAAPVDDVGAGVLANIYQTQPGDDLVSGYDPVVFDLSDFAGQTVRLRFAQVDNQGFFQAGTDNVFILILDPATKDECKDGGWEAFGFRNQGQCVRFVETGKDSR